MWIEVQKYVPCVERIASGRCEVEGLSKVEERTRRTDGAWR